MPEIDFENIRVESVQGGVGVITLNRPEVLNALSYELKCELNEALSSMEKDPEFRAIVITGAGEKAFSAGGDIHQLAKMTPEESSSRRKHRSNFNWHWARLAVPTIGAINGLAYGGGALLSSLFDIRIGCERTQFRFLAAQYGRLNSTWTLPPIVGWARAKELIYTARLVGAEEAFQIGLLNQLVSSDQLLDAAVEMARQIAKNVPECVRGAKALLNDDIGRSWQAMQLAEEEAITKQIKPRPVEVGFADFLARKGRK